MITTARPQASRSGPLTLATGLAGLLLLILHLIPGTGAARDVALSVALVLMPLAAAIAAVFAARVGTGSRLIWGLLAAAATLAVAARLAGLSGAAGGTFGLVLGSAATFALTMGAAMLGVRGDRQRLLDMLEDVALAAGVPLVLLLHWTAGPAAAPVVFATAVWGGMAVLFGAALLIKGPRWRPTALPVAIGSLLIGGSMLLQPLLATCCPGSGGLPLLSDLGWLALAFAGARAATGTVLPPDTRESDGRLRLIVAPATALLFGGLVIDAGLRGAVPIVTAAPATALAVLLAFRVARMVRDTRQLKAERTELAQSRALVEVSRALAGTTLLDETLSLVTEWAVRLLGGRAATIELLSDDGTTLDFHSVHGLPDSIKRLRFSVENSFTGWVVRHGIPRSADDPHRDPYLKDSSLVYLNGSPIAAAPLKYRDRVLGVLSCIGNEPFSARDLALLGALADQAAVAIENARLFQQVHQLSLTDPLTGLPNRRQLEKDLEREFAAARRGRQLIAIMFDLNGFKVYNDRHGHLAGDEALRVFGEALRAETRTMNMAARYGGDEFTALLADSTPSGAEIFIERVRQRFPGPGADERLHNLTVAAGYAVYSPEMRRPADLIAAADRALYLAKSAR